ncbi:MAG TPA: metal-dependent hydrolase [Gaiellaceae bacterium]|nr:metal-dependent hydrolase [Gaiellaceae bacterium]
MATLTWLGHSAFLVESDRGSRIYVDPFLTGNPKTPDDARTPERVDAICITHGHSDHVGDAVELVKRFPSAQLVCQVEIKAWLARKGLAVGDAHGLNKGGRVEVDGVTYGLVNAFHSSSSDEGEYLGEPCGLVIRLEEGKTVYFAGDTCVFGDMALIRRLWEPDYAVLPIGDYFTMGPREAAVAVELLGNPRVVPCHFGTFPILRGTPDELRREKPDADVVSLEPGGTVELV